jgi:hypothetical protein
MLSVSPIHDCEGPHGVRYYLSVVANSRDDYYTGRGERPGVWLGKGAAGLGLSGQVDPDDYLSVMYGRRPDDAGRALERAGSRKTLGWDLTFSAPKSLSLLWAIGGAEVAEAVQRAHDQAVTQTLAFLEAEVARARRRHGGAILQDVDGLVAAGSRTARLAPVTRSSTPTWSWPTRSEVSRTVGGRPWTHVACTPCRPPAGPSTSRRYGPASLISEWPGPSVPTGSAR